MKQLPPSRLVLASELKPLESDSQQPDWDVDAAGPIVVRGPENGLYTVVSGLARFLRDRRNAVVNVLLAREASLSDYGTRETAALIAGKPAATLSIELSAWLRALVVHAPGISEVWLYGSRADGRFRPDSDWDFFAKGPRGLAVLLQRTLSQLARPDVDLFVWEVDAATAINPWNPTKKFTLNAAWHQLAEDYAEYDGTKATEHDGFDVRRCRAHRVWP